ncbi:MAG: disulfide bond formation protein B [Pseudomonadota bacterium]
MWHKLVFPFILVASIGALALAFFTEYVLGFPPCKLCLYQRLPFVGLIKLSLCGIFAPKLRGTWTLFTVMTILIAIAISGYHTGVERGVFEASDRCNPDIQMPDSLSASDIRDMLYAKSVATCTKPPFKVLMLSMTEWNLLFNIGLLVIVLLSHFGHRYETEEDAKLIESSKVT